jgi:hypothetical protein
MQENEGRAIFVDTIDARAAVFGNMSSEMRSPRAATGAAFSASMPSGRAPRPEFMLR